MGTYPYSVSQNENFKSKDFVMLKRYESEFALNSETLSLDQRPNRPLSQIMSAALEPGRSEELSKLSETKRQSVRGHQDTQACVPLQAELSRSSPASAVSIEKLAQPDMLCADQLAVRLGVTRPTINAWRKSHKLLALKGIKRGYRYPAWQIDELGYPIAMLPRLFELIGNDPCRVYEFLVGRHSVLDEQTGLKATRSRTEDEVAAAATAFAAQEK